MPSMRRVLFANTMYAAFHGALALSGASDDVANVLYGPSQSSKSTLICELLRHRNPEAECPTVGDGSGLSVTEEPMLYLVPGIGLFLDTPGNDDTQLRFSNEEAGIKTALGLAKSGVNAVRFVIFESLANDRVELNRTLVSFKVAFGADALSAAIVVATKANTCNTQKREKRLAQIREIMIKASIWDVVLGQEGSLSEHQTELKSKIESLTPIAIKDLQDLREWQKRRAEQLCAQHPVQTKVVEVVVKEQYTEPREDYEEYDEPYTVHKQCTEDYDEKVPYTVTSKCGGRRYGLFGPRGSCTNVEWRTEKKTRTYSCPETAYRKAKRARVVHDVKTREKTVTENVEYRLPCEEFEAEALEQIIKEVRASLRQEL